MLFFLLVLSCVPILYSSFYSSFSRVERLGVDYWALATFLLILTLWLATLIHWKKSSPSSWKIICYQLPKIKWRALFCLALSIVTFIYTRWDVDIPFWLDEYLQFSISPYFTISEEAANQQQPPLDYFLSHLNFSLFGSSLLSARAYAYTFGAFAFIATIATLRSFRLNLFLFSIAIALLGFSYTAIWYNFEARPISLGLFYGVLSFYFYIQVYMRSQFSLIPAFILSGTLFHLSIGLQPSVIFFSLFLVTLFLPNKTLGRTRSLIYLCIPVFLTLPYIYRITLLSAKKNQFHPEVLKADLNAYLDLLTFLAQNIFSESSNLFLSQSTIWLFALTALFFVLSKPLKNVVCTYLRFLAFAVICYGTYLAAYATINWDIAPRYFFIIHYIIILSTFFTLSNIQRLRLLKKRKTQILSYLIAGALIYTPLKADIGRNLWFTHFNSKQFRANWREATQKMHKTGIQNYAFTNMPFRYIGYGLMPSFGLEIYKKGSLKSVKIPQQSAPCLIQKSIISCSRVLNPKISDKFNDFPYIVFSLVMEFTYYEPYEKSFFWRELPEPYQYFESKNLVLLVVPNKNGFSDSVVSFYEEFSKILPQDEGNFFILEELFYYYDRTGQDKKRDEVYQRITELNIRENVNPDFTEIPGINKNLKTYLDTMEQIVTSD